MKKRSIRVFSVAAIFSLAMTLLVLLPTTQTANAGATWAFCANENGTCSFTGSRQVRYGANGSYNYRTFTSSVVCNNANFGGDPIPNVAKQCSNNDGNWTTCSSENGTCSFTGTRQVRYGANGSYYYDTFNNSVGCNNASFGGDPIMNVAKQCMYDDSLGTWCANENGTCSFSGTQAVRFGANGSYSYGTFTNGVACNSSSFGGDPIPNVAKQCWNDGASWTTCAGEGGTCSFSGSQQVRYGANGVYFFEVYANSVVCNSNSFGGDPIYGVAKQCSYSSLGAGGGASGFGAAVSESQFNAMFPNRNSFYTYAALLTAINQSYPAFASTGSTTIQKQEAAAFLANVDQETGGLVYVDEICKGGPYPNCNGAWYCDTSKSYGCPSPWSNSADIGYWGRGPIQLSWNYNYYSAGQNFGVDLLNNPGLVDTDPAISWKTALWYWMTQNGGYANTPHNAMINSIGFAETIRAINGGVECGQPAGSLGNQEMNNRVTYYQNFTSQIGTTPGGNLYC